MFKVPNECRVRTGPFKSTDEDGNQGMFRVVKSGVVFAVIASDGLGWEHVSVSRPDRCPTWPEMCWIKSLFWDSEDTVVQYHPPESQYVNNHNFCLHLWRPTGTELPLPDVGLVGLK